ncbi:hypothetical protein CVT26_010585 [Gymnopilus dilepis]|uniref:Serine aminopeptidase S33 domain-containing protein n=1 Tax=Gymnopilus dilepis TaxID=231916 RepID=A0A409VZG6_9AGAR|nr:hypothetical protein CVT26_010585 [Gymnopilus dilepis]
MSKISKLLRSFWLLFNWQRVLVYPYAFLVGKPRRIHNPSKFGLPYEDVILTTKDKLKLHCYLIRYTGDLQSERARGTVILFHGNGISHGDVLGHANLLYRRKFNVFTLEYRGYGLNDGTPSEKGLCLDSQAAVDYILADPELSKLPIIAFGQSLGGAVAIHTAYANKDKISALIIENTFTSIPDIVKGWPILRHIAFLCTQGWWSIDKIARLPPKLPILMLSGARDRVIPARHMKELWVASETRGKLKLKYGSVESLSDDEDELKKKESKNLFKGFPWGGHDDTCRQPQYWQSVFDFLDDVFGSHRRFK